MPKLRIDILVITAIALALIYAAQTWTPVTNEGPGRSLAAIKRSGELRVLTQNTPTAYYFDRDGRERGFEHDLVRSFAKHLDLKPIFIIRDTVNDLKAAVAAGEADFAAAGLSITRERQRKFLFGPTYQQVSQQVVCRRGGPRPRMTSDLAYVELLIIGGTSYEERLRELQTGFPNIEWQTVEDVSSEQLLEKIWRREVECTVMDSTIVAVNQRYFPELRVQFDLGQKDDIAWLLPKGSEELKEAAAEWLNFYERNGHLASLNERYFGHVDLFDYVDTAAFKRRIKSRYSKYRALFQDAAQKYGLSEHLLAAQSYQESHWNPKARSPTGVRGIMMLTWPTAKQMGVKTRINAEQSIYGGAKYLAKLKSQLADQLIEPDLTWFALAAYNVGLGHLRDAQKLAQRMGRNPLLWNDMKEVLPLLSDPQFYKSLRFGYARGWEPVRYVQRIREYEHILLQHFEDEATPVPQNDESEVQETLVRRE